EKSSLGMRTLPPGMVKRCSCLPVLASQTNATTSFFSRSATAAIFLLSAEKATRTNPTCSPIENALTALRGFTSHRRTVAAADPLSSHLLSGENATEYVLASPGAADNSVPFATSQTRSCDRSEAARRLPSGEKAAQK